MFIRRSYKYYYLRYVLIFLTVVLVISLIWVTPLNYNEADTYSKDEENKLMMQHGILAFIAFSSVTIFVLLTYRILYVNYKDKVFIGLAFISIISYFVLVSAGLVAFVLGKQEKTIRDGQYVFDAFELINTFLFCVSLLFYGFFGLKSLKKK